MADPCHKCSANARCRALKALCVPRPVLPARSSQGRCSLYYWCSGAVTVAETPREASHSSVTKQHPALSNAKSDELAGPRISIVTPTFNRAEYLEEAVHSVLFQGYPHLEYLVIDGGSTDGTLEILDKYPQIRVVSEHDKGMYYALNKGIRLARGEIVGLLNSDDFYEPGAIIQVAACFRADPSLSVVSGGAIVFKEDKPGSRRELARHVEEEQVRLSVANILFGAPILNARFFRRQAYADLGLFDTRFEIAADREFLLRAALAQLREGFVGSTVYAYRAHPGSLTFSGLKEVVLQTRNDHLSIAELHLRARHLPHPARIALRKWHSDEIETAIRQEYSEGSLLKTALYILRGCRYDLGWPLAFTSRAARQALRRVMRKLLGEGRRSFL